MASTSPTPREEKFKQLCAEIDDLILRYPDMPPGRPQSICQSEIEKRYREIDQLNAEQHAEDVANSRPPRVRTATTPGQRQAVGAAMVLVSLGLLFQAYTLIAIGAAIFLFCMGVMNRTGSAPAPEPTQPPRERFQWRP